MMSHTKISLMIFAIIIFIFGSKHSFAIEPEEISYKIENTKFVQNKKQDELEPKEVISISDDELYLLSKLVSSEARGEKYEGQVAVAAVVINRVLDSKFPDNIKDVIYQKNAFSVVANGQIYNRPTDSAYKAAREALYGKDPTSGATYFWNPEISTCNWIKKLTPYKRIGNHVFAK